MSRKDTYNISLEKQAGYYFDWSTFLMSVLLVTVGLLSIYSATYDSGMSSFFFKQLVFAGMGLPAAIVIMYLPSKWIKASALPLYGLSIIFLIAVLIFGVKIAGTKGWLSLGSLSFQPSEFAKLATLLFLARYLSEKGADVRTLRDFLIVSGVVIIPVGLIALQPDIGSASVFGALLLGILFWAGFDLFILYFVISLPVLILLSLMGTPQFIASVSVFSITAAFFRRKISITLSVIAIFIVVGYFSPLLIENLMPHQVSRIETFLNPGSDPRGKGYNVIQSILAVGSGGFAGKGFLQGTQTQLRYIPKQWTDFIYCVPTEEFGFIGGTLVIVLLFGIAYKALRAASVTDNKFLSLACFGIASIFFYHTLINIGMAIGLAPVMGIPLPFLSYGGTSLLLNLAFIGILLNTYKNYKMKGS